MGKTYWLAKFSLRCAVFSFIIPLVFLLFLWIIIRFANPEMIPFNISLFLIMMDVLLAGTALISGGIALIIVAKSKGGYQGVREGLTSMLLAVLVIVMLIILWPARF